MKVKIKKTKAKEVVQGKLEWQVAHNEEQYRNMFLFFEAYLISKNNHTLLFVNFVIPDDNTFKCSF